jgi:hypothetical protein
MIVEYRFQGWFYTLASAFEFGISTPAAKPLHC